MHGKAKEQSEIESEKESIEKSTVEAMGKNKYGNIEKGYLENSLNNNTNQKAEVIEEGENFVVKFIESNRYYEVDSEGNVSDVRTMIEDPYSGDLTKGGTKNGSEENPYEINCIEDLVAYSIMTNEGNAEAGISAKDFTNKNVILTRTLDFKSIFSYNDYTTTKYGDINTDGKIEDIRTELTKTEEGCTGFPAIAKKKNCGIFDGKNNEIKNIYQNVSDWSSTALFKSISEVRNLSISGTIINNKWLAAGICAEPKYTTVIVENCHNYANVTGYNGVGGILAQKNNYNSTLKIKNCSNSGTINITGKDYAYGGAGGIIGYQSRNDETNLEDCINNGEIIGTTTRAGIIGCSDGNVVINNCINKAKSVSGITDWVRYGNANIINCYNIGECSNGIVGSFMGASWDAILELNIKNCYNLGKTKSGIVGYQGTICKQITLNIENCYNAGVSDKAVIGSISYDSKTTTITNIKNTYYDTTKSTSVGATTDGITALSEEEIKNNETFIETLNTNIGENTDWKSWKKGEDGYPTFE